MGNQVSIDIWVLNLFDFQIDLLANCGFQALADLLDVLAFTADQDARLGSVNNHLHLTRKALDIDARDACLGRFATHELTQGKILV